MHKNKIYFSTVLVLGLLSVAGDIRAQTCEASNDVATNIRSLIKEYQTYTENIALNKSKLDSARASSMSIANEANSIRETARNNVTAGSVGSGIAVGMNVITTGLLSQTIVEQGKTFKNLDTIDMERSVIARQEGIVQGDAGNLKELGKCLSSKTRVTTVNRDGSTTYEEIAEYVAIKNNAISGYGTANPMGFYHRGTSAINDMEKQENLDCSSMTVKDFISYAKNGGKGGKCKAADGQMYSVSGATDAQIANAVGIANRLIQTMNIDCSSSGQTDNRQARNEERTPEDTTGDRGEDTPPVRNQAGVRESYCCDPTGIFKTSVPVTENNSYFYRVCNYNKVEAVSFDDAKAQCNLN